MNASNYIHIPERQFFNIWVNQFKANLTTRYNRVCVDLALIEADDEDIPTFSEFCNTMYQLNNVNDRLN